MRAFRANPQAAILIGMLGMACRAFHCIVHNRSRSPLGGAHRRVTPGQIKRKRGTADVRLDVRPMADAIGYKISTRAKATSGSRMIPHLAALMRATRSLSAIRVIDLVVDEIRGRPPNSI